MTDPLIVWLAWGVGSLLLVALAFQAIGCRRKQTRANRRAAMLVRAHLTDEELGELQRYGYLSVPSATTQGRVYRVPARPGPVTVVEAGKPVMRLCLQPATSLPEPEHVLVHKLLLEGAELHYLQRANRLIGHPWPVMDDARVEIWTGIGPGVLRQR